MRHKKIATTFLLVLLVFALSIPYLARGENDRGLIGATTPSNSVSPSSSVATPNYDAPDSACSWWRIWTWPVCLVQGVVVIIGFFVSVMLVIAAWVLEIIFALNLRLFETPAVVTGFSISLSLANLGFVLAIIIIAIMTILRQQSYGLKQTLWKLVVAALLVNFSLVIMKFIVGFSDQFTQYFMYASGGGGSISDFALKFGQAFSPQQVSGLIGVLPEGGPPQDGMMSLIISGFTSIIMLMMIAITLWTFIMMMWIRYVTLGFLAIIMPFAWLLWIFPDTKNNWTLWWKTFLRWTFFAPIVMFFIFLALTTWNSRSSFVKQNIVDTLSKNPNSASQALVDEKSLGFFKSFFANFAETIAEQVLIIGLMMGGMYAANKLSITGAKAGYGAVEGVGKGFGSYVAKKYPGAAARYATRKPPPAPLPAPKGWRQVLNPVTQFKYQMRNAAIAAHGATKSFGARTSKQSGLFGSMINGAAKGSGLWKKQAKNWECQVCGAIIQSAKKPTKNCPSAGDPTQHPPGSSSPDWQEV
ncbi:MAG: hypothetical protein UY56_C0011G0004 [Parcubacteria group bacterium GW2011_GWA1_50_14]|nr:MAG: hypothetical protein UY56_C0011G0004 [Parcubacteria group bacterium GW2011_GWA1_50_14]